MSEDEQKGSRRYPVISPEASTPLIGQFMLPAALSFVQFFGNNLAGSFAIIFLVFIAQFVFLIAGTRKNKGFEWLEIVGEELVFHGRKGVKRFTLANLSVLPLGVSLRIVTPDGKKHSVPQPLAWHGTRPVAEEFYNHLLELGVSIDGKSPPGAPYDPREFKLNSKLTTAVNWRWEGYVKLDPFLEHKIKFAETQLIKISNGMVSIERKDFEIMKVPIRDCTLLRVTSNQIQGVSVRYYLQVKNQGKWPLLDWGAPDGKALIEAFKNRKVPIVQDPPAEEPETEYITDVRKVVVSYNDWLQKGILIIAQVPLWIFFMQSAASNGALASTVLGLVYVAVFGLLSFLNHGVYELSDMALRFSSLTRRLEFGFKPLVVSDANVKGYRKKLKWLSTAEPTETPDFIISGDPGIERLLVLKSLEEKGVDVEALGVKPLSPTEAGSGGLKQSPQYGLLWPLRVGIIMVLYYTIIYAEGPRGLSLSFIIGAGVAGLACLAGLCYWFSVNEWPSPWNQRIYRVSERGLEVLTKRGSQHSIAFGEMRHLVIETRKGFIDQNSARLSIRTLYGRRLVISRWTTRLDPALLTLISLARGRGLEVIIADQDMVDRHKEGEEGEVLYEARRQDGPIDAVVNKVGEETDVENLHA
jgi:hypothetical protein